MNTLGRVLKWLGFGGAVLVGSMGSLFAAGSAFDDPGGWQGAGLAAMWILPVVALVVVAAMRPRAAARVLGAVAGLILVVEVWGALDARAWDSFENGVGPVRAIAIVAVLAPMAVLGLRKPGAAGLMLTAVGLIPVLPRLNSDPATASEPLRALGIPVVVSGVLFLLSRQLLERSGRTRSAPPAGDASLRPA